MPLVLDTPMSSRREPSLTGTIEIALLNNLGDAGLEIGERQIVDVLSEATGSRCVRLRFFSLPDIARGRRARARLEEHYTDFAALTQSRVDGLIVTGCEPRAARLPDEPFWSRLTEVIDWAEHNTRSTIWSCLAAHAAVLHLDGIKRSPLPDKCTGVFKVERASSHPLSAGMVEPLRVPHSRFNELVEDDLVTSGYQILTRSPAAGVDTFVKQWKSLFVYVQGHPEYDSQALRREYRRDVTRFLDGSTSNYPRLPRHYFSAASEAALREFEARARRAPDPSLAAAFPINGVSDERPWTRAFAATLFRNWLTYLQTESQARGV